MEEDSTPILGVSKSGQLIRLSPVALNLSSAMAPVLSELESVTEALMSLAETLTSLQVRLGLSVISAEEYLE